jgi:hypothetical protein
MTDRMIRGCAAMALGLFWAISTANAQVVIPKEGFTPPSAADRALLKGAIDVHVHLDPDSFGTHSAQAARELDVVDMGKRAKKAGMRGFVIKQHYDQTAQLAYITRKEVPGIEVFGQLCLNLPVGGLNPEAVYHFAEIKGGFARIVSMPTWDSANNIMHSTDKTRQSVAVSRNGELLPETKAVIAAIASAKVRDTGATLALATGHIAPVEGLMVLREAKKQGITRMMVTHATGHPVEMTMEQMKEAVSLGAYIEFVAGMTIGQRASHTSKQYYEMIRELGPDNVILSSDSGQENRPYPDDTIATVAGRLRDAGMSAADLRKITVENPATLLGIPQRDKK